MRKLLAILTLSFLPVLSQAQTANAGSDVYMSVGQIAVLNGSASSGSSFQWTEIKDSTWDYLSGATITNATSKIAEVAGLPQGVFYYKLTVDGTAKDTMVVHVNYGNAPHTGTVIDSMSLTNLAPNVNARNDTVNYTGYGIPNHTTDNFGHTVYTERAKLQDEYIDTLRGKYITQLRDNHNWNSSGYDRSEAYISGINPDTLHTYVAAWQGYFPQDSFYIDQTGTNWHNAVAIMQVHGNESYSPPFALNIGVKGNVWAGFTDATGNLIDSLTVGYYADFVRSTHTFELFWHESQDASKGYCELRIDGVTKFRHVGIVGRLPSQDYFKFNSLYDYGGWIVSPDSTTRGRYFQLVSTKYGLYTITDSTYSAPHISTSGNQSITASSTTVFSVASPASGHGISSYSWTQKTGPNSATIASSTSANTSVSSLTTGTYVFGVQMTQDDGQTAAADVMVTISSQQLFYIPFKNKHIFINLN